MPIETDYLNSRGYNPLDFTPDKTVVHEVLVVVKTQHTSLLEILQRGFVDVHNFANMACPQQSPKKKKHKDANSDEEEEDKEDDIPTTYELWQDFLHSLTLHGFRFIFEEGPKIRRIIWLIILILAIMMLVLQSKKSIQKYFDRPITTTVQVEFLDEIIFPAVSICNFNLFPYYLINGTIGEKVRNVSVIFSHMDICIEY